PPSRQSTSPKKARKKTARPSGSLMSCIRSRCFVTDTEGQVEELIITFRRGISEDIARAAVKSAGGNVRRRMRTDYPNEVQLLVRSQPGGLKELEAKVKSLPSVVSTEVNQGGFGVR